MSFLNTKCFKNFFNLKETLAPETFVSSLCDGYNEKSDIWSIGCAILQMWHKDADKIEPVNWLNPNINNECRKFLDCGFIVNRDERTSVFELLQHDYLN